MAHSLEVRPPLLDHRLVEFAFSLSPRLLVDARAGRGKLVLRKLMRERLPPGHLERPKQGFGLPIKRWLAQDPRIHRRGVAHADGCGDPAHARGSHLSIARG